MNETDGNMERPEPQGSDKPDAGQQYKNTENCSVSSKQSQNTDSYKDVKSVTSSDKEEQDNEKEEKLYHSTVDENVELLKSNEEQVEVTEGEDDNNIERKLSPTAEESNDNAMQNFLDNIKEAANSENQIQGEQSKHAEKETQHK